MRDKESISPQSSPEMRSAIRTVATRLTTMRSDVIIYTREVINQMETDAVTFANEMTELRLPSDLYHGEPKLIQPGSFLKRPVYETNELSAWVVRTESGKGYNKDFRAPIARSVHRYTAITGAGKIGTTECFGICYEYDPRKPGNHLFSAIDDHDSVAAVIDHTGIKSPRQADDIYQMWVSDLEAAMGRYTGVMPLPQ